jgi:hypothetical protein
MSAVSVPEVARVFLACAEFGSSGLNRPAEPRNEIEDTLVRAVPDFARWTPPVDERGAGAHAGMGQVADAEGGFQGEGGRIEPGDAVTQVLTEQGRQSSVQNEIGTTWDCDRASDASAACSAGSRPIVFNKLGDRAKISANRQDVAPVIGGDLYRSSVVTTQPNE